MSLAMFFATESAESHWRRTFPGGGEQAAVVRRFVTTLLPEIPCLDMVLLAVDELVVNALRHTKSGMPGGLVIVEVAWAAGTVAVAVTDQGAPTEPAAATADLFAESGRGLAMVSAMADQWGWFGNSEGRTVTAIFSTGVSSVELAA